MTELTEQSVQQAIKREGIEHPILTLLENPSDNLEKFLSEYKDVRARDYKEARTYARGNMGFFAEELGNLGEFEIGELELIAIWYRVEQELEMPVYETAGIIASVYASQALPKDIRRAVIKHVQDTGKFPVNTFGKIEEVERYTGNLRHIDEVAEKIQKYASTGGYTPQDIIKLMESGKPEDMKKAQEIADQTENDETSQFLRFISERFTNGVISQYFQLQKLAKELEK